MSTHFDPTTIESHYSQLWQNLGVYEPDLQSAKRPYYNLMMFPYPSAEGLHVGNMYAFTGADVHGRFRRMQGFNVFEPMGLDGFGIHSENFAIKIGKHPQEQAKISEQNFYRQLSLIGNGFAWNERLETYDPDYYRWTQWLFIQMFKNGLAYKDAALVNWCPSCKTVLADEQVEDAKCERCKSVVERKEMASWYFRITDYADRLQDNITDYVWTDVHGKKHTGLKWPSKVTTAQQNWIGRKMGLEIDFSLVENKALPPITIWTTYWETVFGATYIVLAPEHPLVLQITTLDQQAQVEKYLDESKNKSEQERKISREKTGVFTGTFVMNPATGKQIPVWVADYVLTDVGTGAVMGVPAHDQRDFEFAQEFSLPNIQVVAYADPEMNAQVAAGQRAYEGEGTLVNSGEFDGQDAWGAGKEGIKTWLTSQGLARETQTYHLRDWLISRQRYWGPPIPMIFCQACADAKKGERSDLPGWYAVAESDLPVLLPHLEDYKPKGDGSSPLDNADDAWKHVPCPDCGAQAKRETDVSDTFLDSSWYFLRYPSAGKDTGPFPLLTEAQESKDSRPTWFPVDAYIGGAEHAVLHLLYSRFVTMALHDWGYVEVDEPFPFLFGHGLIIKDGSKMSKSKGNVVNPDEYIQKYGADALRTYLMFLGPYDQGGDFRDGGMHSMYKWLNKVWQQVNQVQSGDVSSPEVVRQLHHAIQENTRDLSELKYNTCIARLMEVMNAWKSGSLAPTDVISFLKLLAPFAPYMTESLYQDLRKKLGQGDEFESLHLSLWPEAEEKYLQKSEVTIAVQVNGKLRAALVVDVERSTQQDFVVALAKESASVQKFLAGKELRKTIFVPGKILNFVVGL